MAHAVFMLDNEGKDKDTFSEYAIFIAFPLQQWLHKHASVLLYT
jgi:hypothetical protein